MTFGNILKRRIDEATAVIYHWCLMPNHFHLVAELPQPRLLSHLMGGCQQIYTMYHHRCYDSAGKLFQGRFKSQAVEKDAYLLSCGRYVERNPVRAGLVEMPWDWPWSSAKFYAFGTPDSLTSPNPLLDGKDRAWYREWLLEERSDEDRLFHGGGRSIGGKEFGRNLAERNGRLIPDGRGRHPHTPQHF